MKKFPGFVRLSSGPLRQKWIKGAIFLTAVALSAGCSKKSDQAASATPQTNAEASSQPTAAPANQAVNQAGPAAQASPGVNQASPAANQTAVPAAPAQPDLSSLNRALRSWILANRRPPRSFDDFAASAGVPIPQPPPGKKYLLGSDMHIQIVNQ